MTQCSLVLQSEGADMWHEVFAACSGLNDYRQSLCTLLWQHLYEATREGSTHQVRTGKLAGGTDCCVPPLLHSPADAMPDMLPARLLQATEACNTNIPMGI